MAKTSAERQRDKRQRDIVACHEKVVTMNVTDGDSTGTLEATLIGIGRQALPGDPDYDGVCEEVDGVWRVKPNIQPKPVRACSDLDLQLRLNAYEGAGWTGSPELEEVMRRRGTEVMV